MVYTGSAWVIHNLAELNIAVPSTTVTPFDIFIDYNGGTPVLKVTDWTNDTTRATALTTQDDVLVQTGNTDWKYLGTGRTTGVSGQIEDSKSTRFLYNYYNQQPRNLLAQETANNWTYTTATWRASNGNTTVGISRVQMVLGQSTYIKASCIGNARNSGTTATFSSGIGIDSTSANSGQFTYLGKGQDTHQQLMSLYRGHIVEGFHYLQALEYSGANDTTTWLGDAGASDQAQSGVMAETRM